MTTPPRPALKSPPRTPDQPGLAEPAGAPADGSAPRVAARKGVPSAVGPDPHPTSGPRLIGWLHIVTPRRRTDVPRATSHCDCGRHITVAGPRDVMALVDDHHDHLKRCPLHTNPEERHAA